MTDEDRISTIEKALVESHRARPEIRADSDWTRRVMARIREERREPIAGEWTLAVQRCVWRFAAVAGTCALLFSSYAFTKGITPERLAAQFFIDDPSGTVVSLIVPL